MNNNIQVKPDDWKYEDNQFNLDDYAKWLSQDDYTQNFITDNEILAES